MSNLENITEKVLNKAKEEASEITNKAKNEAKEYVETLRKEAQDKAKEIKESSEKEYENILNQAVTNAKLKARDERLSQRQEVIDRVIHSLREKLLRISEQEYVDFVKRGVSNISFSQKAELMVPKDKKEAVKKLHLEIPLSDEEVDNGFAIRDENITYNNTFDAILDAKREELESEIVKRLFK